MLNFIEGNLIVINYLEGKTDLAGQEKLIEQVKILIDIYPWEKFNSLEKLKYKQDVVEKFNESKAKYNNYMKEFDVLQENFKQAKQAAEQELKKRQAAQEELQRKQAEYDSNFSQILAAISLLDPVVMRDEKPQVKSHNSVSPSFYDNSDSDETAVHGMAEEEPFDYNFYTAAQLAGRPADINYSDTYSLNLNQISKAWSLLAEKKCLEALAIFIDPAVEKTRDALFGMARCYLVLGNYQEAIQALEQIKDWQADDKALALMGDLYRLLYQFETAKAIYDKIKSAKLAMARLTELLITEENFVEAGRVCQSYAGWQQDKKILTKLAFIKIKQGDFIEAENLLASVKNYNNNSNVLYLLGYLYFAKGEVTAAITHFKMAMIKFPTFANLSLGWIRTCLRASNKTQDELEQLRNSFNEHVKKFNYHYDSLVKYFSFMSKYFPEEAIKLIRDYIKTYPFIKQLPLLLAKAYANAKDFANAEATFLRFASDNNYNPEFYLKYIKLLVNLNDKSSLEKAKTLYKNALEYLPQNKKLHQFIDRLIYTANRQGSTITNRELKPLQMLSGFEFDSIQPVFAKLNEVGEFYLTGSKVLYLLENTNADREVDLDFVGIFHGNLGLSDLRSKGFIPDPYVRNLYHFYLNENHTFKFSIDVFCINDKLLSKNTMLLDDYSRRDFTVCSLFVSKEGKLYDVTGQGLKHFEEKKLCPVGEADILLACDPVIVLRAIKYIMRGYKPSLELNNALLGWMPNIPPAMRQHFMAVLKKNFYGHNGQQYLENLIQYGLYPKIVSALPEAAEFLKIEPGLQQVVEQTPKDQTVEINRPSLARSVSFDSFFLSEEQSKRKVNRSLYGRINLADVVTPAIKPKQP